MKYLLGCLALCSCLFSYAQYSFSPEYDISKKGSDKFDGTEIPKFKKTTTVFIYRPDQESQLKEFENILKENWTITPYLLAPYSEIGKYRFKLQYSLFDTRFFVKTTKNFRKDGTVSTYVTTRIFYGLSMNVMKKGKQEELFLCRIMLNPNMEAYGYSQTRTAALFDDYLHTQAVFLNGGMGYLKNYISYMNKRLQQEQPYMSLFETLENKELMMPLKTQVLYVPDNFAYKMSPFTGKEEPQSLEEVMRKYPGKWERVSNQKINEMILNGEDFYYAIHIRNSGDKYMNVIHSKTGNPVFKSYHPMSYNVKDSDLKEIGAMLKK
ncbi:MAG: hypothetical protein V4616_06590 [Bacteroidota bacterium]